MAILILKRSLKTLSLATVALTTVGMPSVAASLRAVPLSPTPEAPQSLQLQRHPTRPRPFGPSHLTIGCGPNEVMSSWEKPIYDAQGLFVVGWETVQVCIPADLEPAG